MVPHEATGLTEIKFWYRGARADEQKIKTADLRSVRF